jgi:spore germination protein GerM
MIVCSIMVDFDQREAHLSGIFEALSSGGSFLANGKELYFASDSPKVKASWVKRVLLKNGYTQSIIREFSLQNLPRQDDGSMVYGWLIDHIAANAKKEFEMAHQEELQKTSSELDKLNDNLAKMKKYLEKEEPRGAASPDPSKENGGNQDGGKKD